MNDQEYIDVTEHVLRPDPNDDESEKPTPNGQRWSPSHFDRPQQPNDNELSAASPDVNADHLESNTFFSTKNDIAERFCGISYDMDGTQEVQSAAAAATTTRISPPQPAPPRFGGSEVAKAFQGLVPGGSMPGAYIVRQTLGESQSSGHQAEGAAASSGPDSSVSQQDASTEHQQSNYFGKHRKCVVVGTLALLVLFIAGSGIGVAVILKKSSKEGNSPLSGGDSSKEGNTHLSGADVTYCDFQGMVELDIHRQCSCHSLVDTLSNETLARLDDVQAVLGLTSSQVNITSCEPDNISLLLLASSNLSLVSDEIVLNRYVLNIIYLSMGGTNWTNHDGWLESNESCTCCFYGVRCEGESVVAIELPANNLVGTIPSELALVTALSSLDLSGNDYISGTLPTFLGHLTNLVNISLNYDSITGTIPSELGLLSKLESLLLSGNSMKGSIPEELANLTRLIQFGVRDNLIEQGGPIPMWLLKPSMRGLDLANIGFDGSLPSQLGLMTALTELFLKGNDLTGTIPTEIGRLISLVSLNLADNFLEGTIPNDALGRLSHLREVDLSGNLLSGSSRDSEDSGLCGLMRTGNLYHMVVSCYKDFGQTEVVCDCCTDCLKDRF